MGATPPGYAFRGPGLDRSELLRERPDDLRARWANARVMVVDADGHARFGGTADAPEFPTGAQLLSELPEAASFLGMSDDGAWFALAHEAVPDALPGKLDLRSAAHQWPALEAAALAEARSLLFWQQRNRFCGGCGHALGLCKGGWCCRCGNCGLEHYPRTDPAIIVAVSDGPRLLLGRQASWPAKRFSVLAGFVEPGESLEQAVSREVMEEAGVPVLECTYAASQPWPFPAALMIGFHAQGLPLDPVVGDELEQARWFTLGQIEAEIAAGTLLLSPRLSIARWLIDDWMERTRAAQDAPPPGL
ncbi:NAD(+) diphosphatase [Arenimonas sp. MALMAid1274]|uniref:NAD(+) diphosphatase n=1 Tax=Arenimonas sp. MALMAid1274 TaxID=3411630 RepID=UPI003BA378A2